jgi:hypothetical protein
MESIIRVNNDNSLKDFVTKSSMNFSSTRFHYVSRRESLNRHCFGAFEDYINIKHIVVDDSSKWNVRAGFGKRKCFGMTEENQQVQFKAPANASFYKVDIIVLQSWNRTMATDILCEDSYKNKVRIVGYAPESGATQFIRVPLFQKIESGKTFKCLANRPEVSCIQTMIFEEVK